MCLEYTDSLLYLSRVYGLTVTWVYSIRTHCYMGLEYTDSLLYGSRVYGLTVSLCMYGGDQFPGLSEDFPRCRVVNIYSDIVVQVQTGAVEQELAEDLLILKDGQDVDLDGGGAGNHNDIYHHVGPDVIGCGASCNNMDNVLWFPAVIIIGADTVLGALFCMGTASVTQVSLVISGDLGRDKRLVETIEKVL